MSASVAVHYRPKIPPIVAHADCRCPPTYVITTGHRLVKAGRGAGRQSSIAASLCLACGTIKAYQNEHRHWWHALSTFWNEYGWHADMGGRISELADRFTASRPQAYFALAHGLSPDEAEGLRSEPLPAMPKRRRRRSSIRD